MSLVKNLKIVQKDFILDIPQLEILDQGIHLIWGPSGAGKTTFLRALLGLEKTLPGFVWEYQGINLAQLKTSDRNIAVVFQSLDLFPHMTAYENILFAAEARSISKSEQDSFLNEWLGALKMNNFMQRPSTQLSGGEQQRTALLRALITRPRLLFLDEPFSQLDPDLRAEAREMIKSIATKLKIPILIISHDEKDKEIAQKITLLAGGKISISDGV